MREENMRFGAFIKSKRVKDERELTLKDMSDADKALMYDLAARETGDIPSDLDDIMMHSEVGNMARRALRMTNAGVADEEDWKQFIREIEKKKRGN